MHRSIITQIQSEKNEDKLIYTNLLLELFYLNDFNWFSEDSIFYYLAYNHDTNMGEYYWITIAQDFTIF
jgi:hypothetical protein